MSRRKYNNSIKTGQKVLFLSCITLKKKLDNICYHYYISYNKTQTLTGGTTMIIKEEPKNYLLRNVDDQLWTQVKVYAAQKKISIKALILNLLTEEIKKEKNDHL